jgi:drug/metabolite transporter (DMT)-like permease
MSDAVHPQRSKALLMLIGANFFWGLSFPVVKAIALLHVQLLPMAGTWFSAINCLAPRFILSAAVLAALKPRDFWKVSPGELKQGFVIGLFASAGMLLQTDALQFTAASTSAFLTQFYAISIPVYLALRGRRNPGAIVWLSCGLVLAGVAILGHFDWRELKLGRGEWETLIASLFFMGQILWLEKKEFAGNRPERLSFVMFVTQALFFCVLAGAITPSAGALVTTWTSMPWLGLTAILTVFCTLGSYMLMNTWQPKITATEAGLIYCIEPIFGSVMALFLPALFSLWAGINYPNEHATIHLLVGGGLITVANILIQFKPKEKAQQQAPNTELP